MEHPRAKLFDENNVVFMWIIGENYNGVIPLHDLSGHYTTPATLEEPVLETVAENLQIAMECCGAFHDLDVAQAKIHCYYLNRKKSLVDITLAPA